MKNLTKESRLNARQAEFTYLIGKGYIQETYKGVDFFTLDEGKYFTLKVFWGKGANHIEYMNYRSEASRADKIQNYKNNWDSKEIYKAEQKTKGYVSSHAGAAAAIKAELKQAFPGVKFSVTSDSFSMGNSVDIRWVDGPTDNEVSNITCKYQYGHFNGMEDIYENTNSRNDIPQAKYVHTSRSKSDTIKNLLPQLETLLNGYTSDDWHNKPDQILYRIFARTSLPAVYNNILILKTDCTGGSMEDFYCLSFEGEPTQQKAEQTIYTPVEVTAGTIQIVDYSEKAIAVIGDTKPIKDKLKALGGSFNPRLTCGAGWIFPKRKLDEITKALNEEPEPIKKEEAPQQYDSLQEIEAAATGGKVISLLNLCKLVSNV